MGNLSEFKILKIDLALNNTNDENRYEWAFRPLKNGNKPRGYLGMSGLGNPCIRAVWLGWRKASIEKKINPRVKRIFERGDWEEYRIVRDLKLIGCIVHSDQKEIVGFAGHAKGHIDGIVENVPDAPKTPHLAEFKTANKSNFSKFKNHGLKKANIIYYSQIQRYMGGLNLKRGLLIVTNKDNEERYLERIHFDKNFYQDLLRTEEEIIMSELPPEIMFPENHEVCRWCDHKEVCRGKTPPVKNCRTCKGCDIHDKGVWKCDSSSSDFYGSELILSQQLKGCKKHERLF
jgi:hypothetical protein